MSFLKSSFMLGVYLLSVYHLSMFFFCAYAALLTHWCSLIWLRKVCFLFMCRCSYTCYRESLVSVERSILAYVLYKFY